MLQVGAYNLNKQVEVSLNCFSQLQNELRFDHRKNNLKLLGKLAFIVFTELVQL
jgi:hypothetical protein